MNLAEGAARYTHASATSCTSPRRRIGLWAKLGRAVDGYFASPGLAMTPRATRFRRIPWAAHSTRVARGRAGGRGSHPHHPLVAPGPHAGARPPGRGLP